jgi:PAS domain S-box-containing protein
MLFLIRNAEKPDMPKTGCKAAHFLRCSLALAFLASNPGYSQDTAELLSARDPQPPLTNAATVRELTTEQAGTRLPVKLRAVVTFVLDGRNCFLQDESAGIFAGNGIDLFPLEVGDIVLLEGVSGSGEYAPIVVPTKREVIGHTNLPPARRVSFEDLMTGREDSQWVEVAGLVRAVHGDPPQQVMEIATGGGRLTAFVSGSVQTNLVGLVDSRVRLRGVCGTWFNRLRQLFGVRLMIPRFEDIMVEEPAATNALAQPAQPIGNLLRFAPRASYGHKVKVEAILVLQQVGRALFVQDDQHGLYVQTRQLGILQPGDRVELIGFPDKGEYTPTLQDAVWRKIGSGPEPTPVLVQPDEALAGLQDCRLVSIEGRLVDHAHNNRETVLMMEADQRIYTAHLESPGQEFAATTLQNGSRLRLTGVCRIEVGEEWQAGPAWRAKAFRILLRTPRDIQVVSQPPWWTLTRLLWAVGFLAGVVFASLAWATSLRRKVSEQTMIIRRQLEVEGKLRERYQELFESANDMVYTHDLEGRLTSINMAGERLLGRERSAMQQKSILSFIVEEQRAAGAKWLADIIDGTAPATVEWLFVNANGERIRLEISTRLIAHEGRQVEIEGIARDVTERHRLETEILEVSTREQRRIGHDLHDGVCQQLAGIAFLSEILADKLEEQGRPEAAEAHKITELVNIANKQTKGVARGLFPVRLEENGLVSALEELVDSAGAFFKTRCELLCEAPVAVKDHTVAHHLYFMAQEAILNAVRHGKASHIKVVLAGGPEETCVMTVQDNGGGMAVAQPPQNRGMGILIMKYRARIIGAELEVRNRSTGGTEVVCRFSCVARPGALEAAEKRNRSPET